MRGRLLASLSYSSHSTSAGSTCVSYPIIGIIIGYHLVNVDFLLGIVLGVFTYPLVSQTSRVDVITSHRWHSGGFDSLAQG